MYRRLYLVAPFAICRYYRVATLLLTLAVCCTISIADAALVPYNSQAAWLNAVGTPNLLEDFESFLVDTEFRTASVSLNGMSVIATTSSSV